MGKYQLDDKGKALVQRYHDKEEKKKGSANKKTDLKALFVQKAKAKK